MAEKEAFIKSIEESAAIIKQAGEKWPTTFVPRAQVPKFTGGLYSAGTMANADCEGKGPMGGFRIGRQWCYPVDSLVAWLIGKLQLCNPVDSHIPKGRLHRLTNDRSSPKPVKIGKRAVALSAESLVESDKSLAMEGEI